MSEKRFGEIGKDNERRIGAYAAIVRSKSGSPEITSLEDIELLLCTVNFEGNLALASSDADFINLRELFGGLLHTIPGGGVKSGETRRQALKRESLEEVTLNVLESDMTLLARQAVRNYKGIDQDTTLYLIHYDAERMGIPTPGPEMDGIEWVSMENIEQIANKEVHLAFFFALMRKSYELSQPIPDKMYHLIGRTPSKSGNK